MSGYIKPQGEDVEKASFPYSGSYLGMAFNDKFYDFTASAKSGNYDWGYTYYDDTTDSWSTLAYNGLPNYQSESISWSGCAHGNKVYYFTTGKEYITESRYYQIPLLFSFNGSTWQDESNQPTTEHGRGHNHIIYYNNKFHFFSRIHGSGDQLREHYSWDETNYVFEGYTPIDIADRARFIVYKNKLCCVTGSNFIIYEESTNTWSIYSLPDNITTNNISGIYVDNNKLYFIKGNDSNIDGGIYRYDDNSHAWSFVRSCPNSWLAVYCNGSVHILGDHDNNDNARLYILSGDSPAKKMKKGWLEAANKNKFIKIIKDNADRLPIDFYYGHAVYYNERLHILGTDWNQQDRLKHYSYNGTEWVEEQNLLYQNSDSSMVVYDDKIHLIGGYGTDTSKHYAWDGISWTQQSTLPYPIRSTSLVVYNNRLHMVGGAIDSGGSISGYTHYSWDGTEWREESVLPYKHYYGLGAVVYEDKIHILGSGDDNYRRSHYSWNGTLWTEETELPFNGYNGDAMVLGDFIYVLYYGQFYRYGKYTETWTKQTDPPYNNYGGVALVSNGFIHILGGNSVQGGDYKQHYIYDHVDKLWGTNVEIKEEIPLANIKPTDNIQYDHTKKKILNGWIGDNSGTPRLVLNGIPQLMNFNKVSDSIPRYVIDKYGYVSRGYGLAALWWGYNLHLIGGINNIYYSLNVEYGNDPDAYWNYKKATKLTCKKELNLPYDGFECANAVIWYNELHILGGYMSDDFRKHYSYNGIGTWVKLNNLPMDFNGARGIVFVSGNDDEDTSVINIIQYDQHRKWDGTSWTSGSSISDFYIDQPQFTHTSVVYDYINRRILLTYNTKVYELKDGSRNWTVLKDFGNYNIIEKMIYLPCYEKGVDSVIHYDADIRLLGGTSGGGSTRQCCISEDDTFTTLDEPIPFEFRCGSAVEYRGHIWAIGGDYSKTIDEVPYSDVRYVGTGGVGDTYSIRVTSYVDPITEETITTGTIYLKFNNNQTYIPIEVGGNLVDVGSTQPTSSNSGFYAGDFESIVASWGERSGWYKETYYYVPYFFCNGSAVVYDGKVHILGGSQSQTNHYSMEYSRSGWNQESTLPYNFEHGSAIVYKGKIHILGGNYSLRSHYSWNGTSWTQESTLPYDFHDGGVVIYEDHIHILGGYGNNSTNHYSWDGTSWVQESTLPYEFMSGGSVVYDDKIHILGGYYDSDVHYAWDGLRWIEYSPLTNYYRSGSVIVYGDKNNYLFGICSEGISYTGYVGFNMDDDPYLKDSKEWYISPSSELPRGNNNILEVDTMEVYWDRIAMFGTYGLGTGYKDEVSFSSLVQSSMYYDSRTVYLREYNDNVMGTIEYQQTCSGPNEIYSFGGEYDSHHYSNLRNTIYLYKYTTSEYSNGSETRINKHWNKVNFVLDGSWNDFSLNYYDSYSKVAASVIHDGVLTIFVESSIDQNPSYYTQYYRLTYNPKTNKLRLKNVNPNVNVSSTHSYRIDKSYCYGAVSYGGSIYILGGFIPGFYNEYDRTFMYKVNDDDTYERTNLRFPSKNNVTNFNYAVLGNKLHMIYFLYGSITYQTYDFITGETVNESVLPPSSYCGICATSSDFLFIVTYENSKYKLYYLDSVYGWVEGSDDLGVSNLKKIAFIKFPDVPNEKLELFTEKDEVVSQYDYNIDRLFK